MPYGFTGHSGLTTYEPAFEAPADSAVFPFEVLAVGDVSTNGDIKVTVTVEHKNSNDTAFATKSSQDMTSAGITELNLTGLKELIRIKYTFTNTGGDQPQDWICVRMLEPTWYQSQ